MKHEDRAWTDSKGVPFEKIRVEPVYRAIFGKISERILEGSIKSGESLPPETTLAKQFGVNRSSIRESIRLLEEHGLVLRRGKQLLASAPQPADLALRMSRALLLHEINFHELWELMMGIEPMAAAHASDRAADADIAALEDNLRRTRESFDNNEALVELDIEFHTLVARSSHNRALLLAREPLALLFYPAFDHVFSRLNAGERLIFAHQSIVEAIRGRDAATARKWMERHIVDFKRGYQLANLDMNSPIRRGAISNAAEV